MKALLPLLLCIGALAQPAPAKIASATLIGAAATASLIYLPPTDANLYSLNARSTRTFDYGGPGANQVVGAC